MSNDGKALERLVAQIEKTLVSNDVLVDSPKRLPDRVTGKLREHDVVLTFKQGNHTAMDAIECRDRSRPIGVPEVEAFHTLSLIHI